MSAIKEKMDSTEINDLVLKLKEENIQMFYALKSLLLDINKNKERH